MTATIRTTFGLFEEVYRYREVLSNLIARDLKLKYKRTFFGYFWSLLNPILQLAVMGAVFSHIVRVGVKDYTQFLFSGLLAWTFFQSSLIVNATAFLENEGFIKKIYLPKILFPLSRLLLRGIDFVLSLVALPLIGIFIGFYFKAAILALPAAIVLLGLFTLGASILVAIATVYFRDVQYLLNVFLQLLYFATPVLYPLHLLPAKYQVVLKASPLYAQIRLFQRILHDGVLPSPGAWMAAVATAIGMFALGLACLLYFDEELVFRL